jgi:hypothetical protein
MLQSKTRRRIKEHKWSKHSNTSQFFIRIEEQSKEAIKDLTLLAKELDEEQLSRIFTDSTIEPFVRTMLGEGKKKKTDNDRLFFLCYTMLRWSLWKLEGTIDNPWAKKMYSQNEKSIRDIVDSIYHERKKKTSPK